MVHCVEQIGMKFGKNVNRCRLLNLNSRILKICPGSTFLCDLTFRLLKPLKSPNFR